MKSDPLSVHILQKEEQDRAHQYTQKQKHRSKTKGNKQKPRVTD